MLRENEDKLHALALALLEREILDAEEIELLLNGQELEPMEPSGDAPSGDPPDAGATPEEKPTLPKGYPSPDPHPGPA
jgi:cell division protease FtsH